MARPVARGPSGTSEGMSLKGELRLRSFRVQKLALPFDQNQKYTIFYPFAGKLINVRLEQILKVTGVAGCSPGTLIAM